MMKVANFNVGEGVRPHIKCDDRSYKKTRVGPGSGVKRRNVDARTTRKERYVTAIAST